MMPSTPWRNPLPPLALAGALLALGAPGAAAATVTTDDRCYAQGAPLRMWAAGFAPRAPLVVALDGQPLRYRDGSLPVADASGGFASSFATPALPAGANQRRHLLAVGDGAQRAHARFAVTRPPGAAFAPSEGDPRRLRARFSVWGFALDADANAQVWLHWVSPRGRVRRTVALGTTRGLCGALTTRPRAVFPFDPAPGRWVLVVDTAETYRVQPSGPRAKIPVHVRALPRRS